MRQETGNIFEQQKWRSFGFNHTGNFKEQSASGIFEALSFTSLRKGLAGESSTEKVEVWEFIGVDLSCIWVIALTLLYVMDCGIACVGILVDFAVAHTLEIPHTG